MKPRDERRPNGFLERIALSISHFGVREQQRGMTTSGGDGSSAALGVAATRR
jgi:hypothetical protein